MYYFNLQDFVWYKFGLRKVLDNIIFPLRQEKKKVKGQSNQNKKIGRKIYKNTTVNPYEYLIVSRQQTQILLTQDGRDNNWTTPRPFKKNLKEPYKEKKERKINEERRRETKLEKILEKLR